MAYIISSILLYLVELTVIGPHVDVNELDGGMD